MSHHWDEFSKSLAEESLPRRESLRRLGLVLAGAVLSPLGLQTARAAPNTDPCKAFCRCSNKAQQNKCLTACRACNKDPSRLCGTGCGNYFCCEAGLTCCSHYCADLADDPWNCGGCGRACEPPGPYEYGACVDGECRYACAEGAVYCGDTCTFLEWDPDNCGACGNVCPASAPACTWGSCSDCPVGTTNCDGVCVDVSTDNDNCGACGYVCPDELCGYCDQGLCLSDCGGGDPLDGAPAP